MAFNARRLDLRLASLAPGDVCGKSLTELVQVRLHGRRRRTAGDRPLFDKAPWIQGGSQVRRIQVHRPTQRLSGRFGDKLHVDPRWVRTTPLDYR